MSAHLRSVASRARRLLIAVAVAGVLATPLVAATPSSASSSSSPFCSDYRSWMQAEIQAPLSTNGAPTASTAAAWRTYGKREKPYFAKMVADAPNAKIKAALNIEFQFVKYYASTTSAAKLEAYFAAHQTKLLSWDTTGQLSAEEYCIL
jgi:hypothetical protein